MKIGTCFLQIIIVKTISPLFPNLHFIPTKNKQLFSIAKS
jgi:hypothetical protein